MLDEFTKWLFDQGAIVVSYAAGVMSSYFLIKKVNEQRFESLEKSIKFLKDLLDKTRMGVEASDAKCDRRVSAVLEENESLHQRIQRLEDSRVFILQNALKDKE